MRGLLIAASTLAVVATLACTGTSSTSDYCPDFSQKIDETRRLSMPPNLTAASGGESVELNEGPSEWCHIVSDQFDVVTGKAALSVAAGTTVEINNPMRKGLVGQSISVQGPQGAPTPRGDYLVWPDAGWGGGPGTSRPKFKAPEQTGTYIVVVSLRYERVGTPDVAARREAYYAFVLEVTGD